MTCEHALGPPFTPDPRQMELATPHQTHKLPARGVLVSTCDLGRALWGVIMHG